MRIALRGRGTRHDDLRDAEEHHSRRPEPAHVTLRTEPRPVG
jgi:hypothetical protein